MATHRLAVDDRPAWRADLLQEKLTERDEVLDEQMGLILARAIARGDPRVTSGDDVAAEGRGGDRARPRPPLDPVREHDETAAPVRRHFDEIVRAAEHAAPADRRARWLGSRRVGPWHTQHDEREAEREQSDERASWRHVRALPAHGQRP